MHLISLFVVMGSAVAAQPAQRLADNQSRVEPGVYAQIQADPQSRPYIIVMLRLTGQPRSLPDRRSAVRQLQDRVLAKLAIQDFDLVYRYRTVAAMTGRVGAAGLAKLSTDPDVLVVGLDAPGTAHLDDSVEFINAGAVHGLGYTGQGMTVAVLDSGIDTDHADLSDDIAAGAYHFLDQGANQGPGAEDDNGHGTNVAGIITSRGVIAPVGVAPDADILAIKVLEADGGGWLSDWAAGVDYVVDHQNDYANLCAINMSLGSFTLYSECPCDSVSASSQALQAAIQAARDLDIVTFASSGNNGSCTSMSSPACLSAAVAVAAVYDQALGREPDVGTYQNIYGSTFASCFDATTAGDDVTCFSNRSACNALAAPGRMISAPGLGGGISTFTGTSQAAPHCAAVAALMREKCLAGGAGLKPDELEQILMDTGLPTSDLCATEPHPVRIDALAAVEAVCHCPADLNNDRMVNVFDLDLVLGAWGSNPGHAADMNNDGVVGPVDLALLLGHWGACT